MRNALALAPVLSMAFMLSACGGPVGPIAGKALDGTPTNWPSDWSFSEDNENILLETNPTDPYSVTLWAVDVGNDLYITAVDPESQWVRNLQQDSAVTVCITGKLYAGRAHVVTNSDEMDAVGKRYGTKYEMSPEEGASIIEEGGIIFRLSAR